MPAAEHREPYESRGSRTVLGARGGEIPLRDSPAPPFLPYYAKWRVRPLTSRLAVIELIAATTTTTGLTVECELDTNTYQKGIKITAAEMATLNIERNAFHPEWNYTIAPRGASND
jgi:hypothetical protein